MIVVTGAAGFIGSAFLKTLNDNGHHEIIAVDDFGTDDRWKNLRQKRFADFVNIKDLEGRLEQLGSRVRTVVHFGACSTTTEKDMDYLLHNNTNYSKMLFQFCANHKVTFLYASSAATYGGEESSFSDSADSLQSLKPLNKYGFSKHLFDLWAMEQRHAPPSWVGLKFFNVYGPNEYHKGGQASVVYHAFNQIQNIGCVRLFKSYRKEFADGEQVRDFIYVKDVTNVMLHLMSCATKTSQDKPLRQIYNLGTGVARSFKDLAHATFAAMKLKPKIEWIEMPDSIKHQYQYYTQAEMSRFRAETGYDRPFSTLEQGIQDYVQEYLLKSDPFF
ncbi:MAG: ADP-glyceromanno-heptose 6-epimerase [Oligoflexales bacterium]